MTDLAGFLAESKVPLDAISSILDVGSGDGRRIIHALACNTALNRPEVHVTCVDFSVRAIVWGVDLWKRLRDDTPPADYQLPPNVSPLWSMEFRNEDATSLPVDIRTRKYELVIDWMMLHGMPCPQVEAYAASLMQLGARFIVLNCFSQEGATVTQLSKAVEEVEKRQWSQAEVEQLFSDHYNLLGRPYPWPEDLNVDDGDGIRAAKQSYCFERKS